MTDIFYASTSGDFHADKSYSVPNDLVGLNVSIKQKLSMQDLPCFLEILSWILLIQIVLTCGYISRVGSKQGWVQSIA